MSQAIRRYLFYVSDSWLATLTEHHHAQGHGFKPPARTLLLEISEKQEKGCPDSEGPPRQNNHKAKDS